MKILNINDRHSRAPVITATLIVSLAIFGGALISNGHAEEGTDTKKPQNDPFILGPSMAVKSYTSREALQWGADFLLAPTAAKDRVVLYAYEIPSDDDAFFKKLKNQLTEQKPKIAVISTLPTKKLRFLGNESGYFGVPIILDTSNNAIVGNFVSIISSAKGYQRLLPAIMTVSALKANGIDLSAGLDWKNVQYEKPWSGKLATTIRIPGTYHYTTYVASASGWDVSQNPPETIATLSELEKRISAGGAF